MQVVDANPKKQFSRQIRFEGNYCHEKCDFMKGAMCMFELKIMDADQEKKPAILFIRTKKCREFCEAFSKNDCSG